MLSTPGRTGWIASSLALRALLPALLFALALAPAADGLSQAKGKKNEVATDPAKTGPDYSIQGEYLGNAGNGTYGAEVIARGDGKFDVNFLPGGVRGAGGDYGRRIQATAHTEGDKVLVRGKGNKWTAAIERPIMKGMTDSGQAFTLRKIIRESKTLGKAPPADAVVLFNGKDTSEWNNGKMVNGNLLGSDIASKKKFRDHKIHLEFRLSFMPKARGQGRSNSGVYVQHRYEIQVLDSFGLKGENNECGGVYSQAAPLVNMCYPPLQWQTYDIDFRTARFKDGKKVEDALLTLRHNGVLVHNRLKLKGPTPGGGKESDAPGALFLQGHGGQVEYRNIWVVTYDKAEKR
jgi:hypothetical protein